jgi:uncharacterized protein YcbK (DUF882 family)
MLGNATVMPAQEHTDSIAGCRSRSRHPVPRRTLLGAAIGSVLLSVMPGAAAEPWGDRKLALYNPHTDERFDDVYWCDGQFVQGSLQRINWLMRDFHRDQMAPIDPNLLDLLHRISGALETPGPIQILSGYRTAATNRLLRREGLGAAANSEHLLAKAADIRIGGVRLKHLRRAAVWLRAGGVGTYWQDGFVHVDVGAVRVW